MSSPGRGRCTTEEFNFVIKHTFIQAKSPSDDSSGFPTVHRRTSEPTRALPPVDYAPEPLPTDKSHTPSTCLSVNGDDWDEEGSRPQDRRCSFASVDSDYFIGSFGTCHLPAVQTFPVGFEQPYPSDNIGFACDYTCDVQGMWSYPPHELAYATIGQTCYPANYCNDTGEVFSTASPLQQMPSTDVSWQESNEGEFGAIEEIDESKTTVMVRNLQSSVTQGTFVQRIRDCGFSGLFDFVYMPMNFRGEGNFGYAFVNFHSATIALRFMAHIKALEVDDDQWRTVWSTCQGLSANIERYRNSPLMHELIPMDCKPAIYDENGAQVAFPAPTKPFKKPRIHFAKLGEENEDKQEKSESAREAEKTATRECRPGRSKKQQQNCQSTPAYWSSGGHVVVSEAALQQHTVGNSGYANHQIRASPR